MASMTLHVPADLVELLHEELGLLQEVKRESVHVNASLIEEGARSTVALNGHRSVLGEVDGLLAQVLWDEIRPDEAAAITARSELLADVVYGMLLVAGDRVAEECHRSIPRGFDLEQVEVRREQLTVLVGLLRSVGGRRPPAIIPSAPAAPAEG